MAIRLVGRSGGARRAQAVSTFRDQLEAAYVVIADVLGRVQFYAPIEQADLDAVRELLETELPGHRAALMQPSPALVNIRITEPSGVVIYARNKFVAGEG